MTQTHSSEDPFQPDFINHRGDARFLESVMTSLADPSAHAFLAVPTVNVQVKPFCTFCGHPEAHHSATPIQTPQSEPTPTARRGRRKVEPPVSEPLPTDPPKVDTTASDKAFEQLALEARNARIDQWLEAREFTSTSGDGRKIWELVKERGLDLDDAVHEAMEAGAKSLLQVHHYLETGLLGDEFDLFFPDTRGKTDRTGDGFDVVENAHTPGVADSVEKTLNGAPKTPERFNLNTGEIREFTALCVSHRWDGKQVRGDAWNAGHRTFADLIQFCEDKAKAEGVAI